MRPSKWILPVVVISQFCCTSLWFASNGVMTDLIKNFNLEAWALGHLTSAVQFGFITGTLIFAILTIADRFPPSRVFLISALMGALFNLCVLFENNNLPSLLTLRFLTGFFLAGIYPVGMKIAADHYEKGLGRSLGFLVGALVIGTAFPHLLKGITGVLPWKFIITVTSGLAVTGGSLMFLLVPNGPYRKPGPRMDFSAFFKVFKNPQLRSAAFGYFGHMWELYAFWAFVPVLLMTYSNYHPAAELNIPLLSFLIIGVGGMACVVGGYLSGHWGTKRTAFSALLLSFTCCLLSPFFLMVEAPTIFIAFLIFWGMVVIADSPLFSTLVAQNALAETKGTALTIVNCIGFSITIISIQLMNTLHIRVESVFIYTILALGPLFGMVSLGRQEAGANINK